MSDPAYKYLGDEVDKSFDCDVCHRTTGREIAQTYPVPYLDQQLCIECLQRKAREACGDIYNDGNWTIVRVALIETFIKYQDNINENRRAR